MQRSTRYRAALAWAIAVLLACGAGTESGAQESRQNATVKAVQKVKPSVVTVKVPNPSAKSGQKELIGTGLIIDERGYIVTNRHVVAAASEVKVRLLDNTEHKAKVILSDPDTDLAILRVDVGKKLPAQTLAPASDLKEGEDVIAVGHPFGYSYTVSKGILSALEREITLPSGQVLAGLIQTDASINPGNSGGPLLNINGEVIGINVALREGAQGIAFAITTDTVKRVLSEHLSALKIAGVQHGLLCQDKIIAETGPRQRVVVAGIDAQTPAAQAGLKTGDQILCVAHRPVANCFDFERSLWDAKPGQQVALKVLRQGRELQLMLTLSSAPGTVDRAPPAKEFPLPAKHRAITVRVKADDPVAGFILPGSRVDVISTVREGKDRTVAMIVIPDVLVLATEAAKAGKNEIHVTVAVPDAIVERVAKTIDKDKTYTIAVRAPSDAPPGPILDKANRLQPRAYGLRVADPQVPLASLVGARVDVLATTGKPGGTRETKVLLQKVRVLAADQELRGDERNKSFVITLEVDEQGARRLAVAQGDDTTFHVIVRVAEKK